MLDTLSAILNYRGASLLVRGSSAPLRGKAQGQYLLNLLLISLITPPLDTVYNICCSLMLLGYDLTHPLIKNKMSKREFIRNTREITPGVSNEYLGMCGKVPKRVQMAGPFRVILWMSIAQRALLVCCANVHVKSDEFWTIL